MKAIYFIIAYILFFLVCCKTVSVKREIKKVQEITTISKSHKFIKAHMKDGTVYVLYNWYFDMGNNSLNGYGSLLDINRDIIISNGNLRSKAIANKEQFNICISDISLLETNDPSPSIAGGLTVVTGVTAGFTIYCLINPKACFGSCPTFFAFDGDTLTIQAEGFSSSISPSLEKNDVDMLYTAKVTKDFELIVTNEALETHSIRSANLLVFEKQNNERVFVNPGGVFYKTSGLLQPTRCQNSEGECLSKVVEVDGDELFSLADPDNLASKEEIVVTFSVDKDEKVGLVVGKRQTLLTTFLMYQGLAYMGKSATYWMAEFERGMVTRRASIFEVLGGIEVFSKDTYDQWKLEGVLNETGPIATDFNIIPLANIKHGNVELKLRLNKGLWRIDYLGLVTISEKVVPTLIQPIQVETIAGAETDPLSKLINVNDYLVTYPGDAYRIKYNIPYENAELFLDSKGYYLEWIRDEWVIEQNFKKLNLMVSRPMQYLKNIAPAYKRLEPLMEESFWNSKYVKK
jgi:hypothetical protein